MNLMRNKWRPSALKIALLVLTQVFGRAYEHSHKNFLRNAVYFLYVYNRKAEAAKWYKYMIDLYPKSIPVPDLTLDEYCVSRVQEDAGETDHNQTKAVIAGLLMQAFQFAAVGKMISLWDIRP